MSSRRKIITTGHVINQAIITGSKEGLIQTKVMVKFMPKYHMQIIPINSRYFTLQEGEKKESLVKFGSKLEFFIHCHQTSEISSEVNS